MRETILRSVRVKDLKGAVLKASVLKPPLKAPYEISLIRRRIGDHASKRAATKHVHSVPGEFGGFAKVRYRSVAHLGYSVVDDRKHFLGHANLQFPFELPRGETAAPAMVTPELAEAWQKVVDLAALFEVVRDPDPAAPRWTGPSLR